MCRQLQFAAFKPQSQYYDTECLCSCSHRPHRCLCLYVCARVCVSSAVLLCVLCLVHPLMSFKVPLFFNEGVCEFACCCPCMRCQLCLLINMPHFVCHPSQMTFCAVFYHRLYLLRVQVAFMLQWLLQESWITTMHPLSWLACSPQCVCARHWKREEIDQHREERVHQQRLDGGCERERVRNRKREGCCCRLLLQYLTLGMQLQTGSNRQARHADRYRPGVMGGDEWGLGVWWLW